MSLSSLLGLARDAMSAQSAALDIVGQNITGANTKGYVRRSPLLENRALGGAQSGGVVMIGVARLQDRFAMSRVISESGLHSAAMGRADSLAGLEAWLAPPSGGIGDGMAALFSAANDLAQNPGDSTTRTAFLARADEISSSFRVASNAISSRRGELLGQAQDVAGEVNDRLAGIATLNKKIAEAQALGQPATDMRDQRDTMIRDVAERIGVDRIDEPNGMVTLLSSGSSLVTGAESSRVNVDLDQGALRVRFVKPSGSMTDVTRSVDGGTLGGIREARDTDLVAMNASLDQLAYDFVQTTNAVHASGVGSDGVSGRPLFTPAATVAGAASAMTLDSAMRGQPDRVAASQNAADLPSGNQIALQFAGLADISLAGGGTPAGRFGTFAGELGSAQIAAESAVSLRQDTLTMASNLNEQSSGVSVEEEMVDLTRYQRAFEASMRVLQVADELLQGLIREI